MALSAPQAKTTIRLLPTRPGACAPATHDAPDAQLEALVRAARDGDGDAWRRLVERFDRRLRRAIGAYRLSPADVDDALQATWLHLFTHLRQIREPAAIGGWLATTARRECLRILQTPVREQLSADPALSDGSRQDGPEIELLAAERRAALGRALATLPERHRRVMALLVCDAAPDYRQIAHKLDMPIGSIGPIRARSLARMKRHPELRGLQASFG